MNQATGTFDKVCADYAMSKFASSQDARLAMLEEIQRLRETKAEMLEALTGLLRATDHLKGFHLVNEEARVAIARATPDA